MEGKGRKKGREEKERSRNRVMAKERRYSDFCT